MSNSQLIISATFLLLTGIDAAKLVPATRFTGVLPKVYEGWSCPSSIDFPFEDAQTRAIGLTCLTIAAERRMHLCAGALARNGDDRLVFNDGDVEYECDLFREASRAGAVFSRQLLQELDTGLHDLTLFDPAMAVIEAIEVPDVSKWCGPNPVSAGLA